MRDLATRTWPSKEAFHTGNLSPYPAPLEDNMGRKQPKYPDGSNTHQIHTPTSDHRMDAEGKDAKQKDLNQRQTGHQQTGDPPGKRRTSNKPAERPETEPLM